MYLHVYGKSGLQIATNTNAFVTQLLLLKYLEESPI